MTKFASRLESLAWVFWTIILFSVMLAPWTGAERPHEDVNHYGVGYVAYDAITTVMLWLAVGAHMSLQVWLRRCERLLRMAATWFMTLTLVLLASRLTWLFWITGDPQLSATMLVVLNFLSLSVILNAVDRILYAPLPQRG